MKYKDLARFIQENELSENVELYNNDSIIYDIEMKDNKLIFKSQNALNHYYNYKENILNARAWIKENLVSENIIMISEIEAVTIAHKFDLSFKDVKNELASYEIQINEN